MTKNALRGTKMKTWFNNLPTTEPPLDPPEPVDPKAEVMRRDQEQADNIQDYLGDIVANDPLCQILQALREVTGHGGNFKKKDK